MMKIFPTLTHLFLVGCSFMTTGLVGLSNIPQVMAQPAKEAVVFDPPSNIRVSPNGPVLCSLKRVTSINVYGLRNGWYVTDICGQQGYIHQSQIRFQSNNQPSSGSVVCDVVNIERGQLALRFSPNGKSRAGLNNGNTVRLLSQQGIWYQVRVIQGPNRQVNGLQGWVNSNYLSCDN